MPSAPDPIVAAAIGSHLSMEDVLHLTDADAQTAFLRLRWGQDGPCCPRCGCRAIYAAPKRAGALRLRCKQCRCDFTSTSGTIFAFKKTGFREFLIALAGALDPTVSIRRIAGLADLNYRAAHYLVHRIRSAI